MAAGNPFKPSFGASPPVLAGRAAVLESLAEAFDDGPSHPDFTSLLVGARGTGKTATLNAIGRLATERDWPVIAESAHGDMCARLAEVAHRLLNDMLISPSRARITGVSALGVRVQLTDGRDGSAASGARRLRQVLSELAVHLAAAGRGVLVTLDELQGVEPAEMREFAATVQHVTRREELPAAFVAAGLPSVDDSVMQDSAITFLQRCSRHEIAELPEAATSMALAEPITARGGRIDTEALRMGVAASGGYPFMVQLIGYHAWRAASGDPTSVTTTDMEHGIAEAERRLPNLVLGPMWRSMSDMDRRFALAMVQDEGESAVADIARRLDRSSSYVSTYRQRLIRAGFIRRSRRGHLGFAHRTTRDWLSSANRPD